MSNNTIIIFFSEEDEGYIAVAPELPGCSAFGETEEEALREIKTAIELWLTAARKEGRNIPHPQEEELLTFLYGRVAESKLSGGTVREDEGNSR